MGNARKKSIFFLGGVPYIAMANMSFNTFKSCKFVLQGRAWVPGRGLPTTNGHLDTNCWGEAGEALRQIHHQVYWHMGMSYLTSLNHQINI